MASDLAAAIRGLHLDNRLSPDIDDILFQQRPRKRVKQDASYVKAHLEADFLTPSTQFSSEWLSRLQQ